MKSLHKYLRAVGFSQFNRRKAIQELIRACVLDASSRTLTTNGEDTMLAIYCKDFAPGLGLAICGELDENNNFTYDYYYPYLKAETISSSEDISIERHAAKESYAGVCDDLRVGVSLIFYLQNMIDYVRIKNSNQLPIKGTSLCLSALSNEGMIMMPINKNEYQKESIRKKSISRNRLLQAARKGDEAAIESLTLDDMDTYTSISRKIHYEDVFSIVDTYFMPYGVECDQYSVLGEIQNCKLVENSLTREKVYVMTIDCNELIFDVCINEKDVFGEPKAGRRFKGIIWLQGYINFPK
ncbi:MAG: DUF3881 family protein [Lachnospiraceae bacterium]|nr:DUF3881 family protein [Lachnospiraceae bacterium]